MGRYTNRQIAVVAVTAVANSCSAICYSLQAPFFPAEAEAKGASATEFGFVFGVFQLMVFIVSPILGNYIGTIGAKFMFNSGLFLTGSTCILFGFLKYVQGAWTFTYLAMAIRIVEALGNAGFLTASFSIIAQEFPDDIATTFATLETFYGLGLIVGPSVGGALYELGGFSLPFFTLGLCLLLSLTVTQFLLPPINMNTVHDPHGGTLMFKLLQIPNVLVVALGIVCSSISIGFVQATLEPHIRPLGLTPFQTGLVFVLNGATYAMTAPVWGKICDKGAPPNVVILIGSLFIIVAFILVGPAPFLPLTTTLGLVIASLSIHGIGLGAQMVATFIAAYKDSIGAGLPDNLTTYGLVSGTWTSSFALGAFIGPSSGGALYDALGFRTASMFVVCLQVIIFLIFLLVELRERKSKSWDPFLNGSEEKIALSRDYASKTNGSMSREPGYFHTDGSVAYQSMSVYYNKF